MIDPEDELSFALKRLLDVEPALGAVWATTAAHLAPMGSLQVEMHRFAKCGVATEEGWSDSSEL